MMLPWKKMIVPFSMMGLWTSKWNKPPHQSQEPNVPFYYSDESLVLPPGSKLASKLEIMKIGRTSGKTAVFRTVGQIIALSNTSGALAGNPAAWVELDPRLSASVGLHLPDADAGKPGTAYGLATLAAEYGARISGGQRIGVARYALGQPEIEGVIVQVVRRPDEDDGIKESGDDDPVDVIFRLSQAQDWFPGTNCEVIFPMLRGFPVKIPTTAPVHHGTAEYVWKEVAPGRFKAQHIGLVDSTPSEASVLGLKAGERIVTRGAILLKPLLKPLLTSQPW